MEIINNDKNYQIIIVTARKNTRNKAIQSLRLINENNEIGEKKEKLSYKVVNGLIIPKIIYIRYYN